MKQTTGSITISRTSHDLVMIRIKDDKSLLPVAEIALTIENYGRVLTGLSEIKGELKVYDNYEAVAKERETKSITMPKIQSYDKEVIADAVKVHFKTLPEALEGWTIHTDGTSTKQSGEVHKYSIKRYV